jgi:hypothetical protein
VTAYSAASKARLTAYDIARFSGDSLFDRIARAVCRAGCLPRKELYEAWEMARRVRRRLRGGRVVDLAAGHGLLGHVLLILDNSSPSAVLVDTTPPPSAERLHQVLLDAWPRLEGRITVERRSLADLELDTRDVVVSSHACGELTDIVLDRAVAARARVAVLPCCHHVGAGDAALSAWLDGALASDVRRALHLEARGYRVWTQTLSAEITPKNRLLIGAPRDAA